MEINMQYIQKYDFYVKRNKVAVSFSSFFFFFFFFFKEKYIPFVRDIKFTFEGGNVSIKSRCPVFVL